MMTNKRIICGMWVCIVLGLFVSNLHFPFFVVEKLPITPVDRMKWGKIQSKIESITNMTFKVITERDFNVTYFQWMGTAKEFNASRPRLDPIKYPEWRRSELQETRYLFIDRLIVGIIPIIIGLLATSLLQNRKAKEK